ncbi:MAG: carbon-nitrogen hydrolase family protein [Bacteroidota bacterium]
MSTSSQQLHIAMAQMAAVWLDQKATIDKMCSYIQQAGQKNCDLIVFGEALLPGYPFWLDLTGGAKFNSSIQKEIHAHYLSQSVQPESGDLDPICQLAKEHQLAVVLGCIERAADRGGHSLYCSLVYISKSGQIENVHRKLMPTYEERLTWAPGDGYGLRTFPIGPFTMGGLNCWENWMPLPRAALYGMGEDLHLALWPGCVRNTEILTRFLAREGRSYVVSVCGLMRREDFPATTPHVDLILEEAPDWMADGGSCIAAPDGSWLLPPIVKEEGLFTAVLDHQKVKEERQNFDPAGHYSRPDVTQLIVRRERQSTLRIEE